MREGGGLTGWSVAVIVCVQPDPGPEFVRVRKRDAVRTGVCVCVRAGMCMLAPKRLSGWELVCG